MSPVIDIPPLTLTLTSASGEPSAVEAVTPAKRPFNASAAELTGISFKSFALTLAIDANTFLRFTVWYPITTTSSVSEAVELSETLMVDLLLTATV